MFDSTGLEKRSLACLIVRIVRRNDDLSESNTPSKTADGSSNTAIVFDSEIKNTGKNLAFKIKSQGHRKYHHQREHCPGHCCRSDVNS